MDNEPKPEDWVYDHLDEMDDELEREWTNYDYENDRVCSFPCEICGESWPDEYSEDEDE